MCQSSLASAVDVSAVVDHNAEVAPQFYRMRLQAPELAPLFRPGQFFQLRIDPLGDTVLLRRPFAPSRVDGDCFEFIYAVVGEGTQAMKRLGPGAVVQVLGPLGNGYELPASGRALLVGGGCGTPSLRLLGEVLRSRGIEVHAVIGARSACTLLERESLAEISTSMVAAADDGTAEFRGHAVAAAEQMLDRLGDPAPSVFACGPHPMLKGLAHLARQRGLDCQVSLEERMACGFGACMGCAVAVRADNDDGFVYRRVCVDGPVFRSEDIVW